MGRPAGNADKLLIAAAKEIACESGCSGLTIRDVARRAGVNLGMFHYHFRNKKRFTRVLLEELYDGFFARLSIASCEGPDALAQLRNSLVLMGLFIRDERHLVCALIKDVVNGDKEVLRFIRNNLPRHVGVIRKLLAKCEKEGTLPAVPFYQAMGFIMSSLNMPSIIGGMLETTGRLGARELKHILSDRAIEQRVEMALAAIRAFET